MKDFFINLTCKLLGHWRWSAFYNIPYEKGTVCGRCGKQLEQ